MFKTARAKFITIFLVLVALVGVMIFGRLFFQETPEVVPQEDATPEVMLARVADLSRVDQPITRVGTVISTDVADVLSESTGRVQNVYIREGDRVSAGDVIAVLDSAQEEAAVAQAEANLRAQRAQLEDTRRNAGRGESGSRLRTTIEQQEQLVENARQTLLNTDLQAYPEDPEDPTGPAPVISGFYEGDETGSYIIDLYSSRSRSGASFEVSGLEENILGTVDTETPVPLGTRGLFIEFPEGYSVNDTWIVPIPNTRSSQYLSARNSLRAAEEARDAAIAQAESTAGQVAAQEAQVESAAANLTSAEISLDKTMVRAPVSGTVTELHVDIGDTLSTFGNVASISGRFDEEIQVFVTPKEVRDIAVGAPVLIDGDMEGRVISILPTVDPQTQKSEVRVAVPEAGRFLEGEAVRIKVERSEDTVLSQVRIPVTALQITPEGSIVFRVDEDNRLIPHRVVTGPLLGSDVIIEEGLSGDMEIVTDARGLEPGQEIIIGSAE